MDLNKCYMFEKKYIVALGASSGGLNALCEFFDHTLPDGVTYIITTHLDPFYKSKLNQIIQVHSDIEVCIVEHDMEIQSNMIYVMPENKVMFLKDGNLILKPRDLSSKVNKAIDIFFKSLADDTLFSKIAIILSGMGHDGTEGVKALAEKGAYIIAQTGISADYASMPESIVFSGYANEILSPSEMPEAIINYVNHHH